MTTIVFTGQGSQFIEMAKDFYDNYPVAKNTFDIISKSSGIDVKSIIFNNPSDKLNQTQYTQISIFCASMSIYNVLISEIDINKLDITNMLGHSLGEYTALTASKILSIDECAKLLKIRGELMQNAFEPNQSGMAAIIGLTCKDVENIINKNNLKIEIANDNSPLQVVISGINDEINKSELFFKNGNAKKFLKLNVSSAFHSKLMINAQNKMKNYINNVKFNKSPISIISNFTGNSSNNIDLIKENLCHQMSNRVRWVESVKHLESLNEKNIIEIGPKKVLTGLLKRISSNFEIKNIEYIEDITKIKNEF